MEEERKKCVQKKKKFYIKQLYSLVAFLKVLASNILNAKILIFNTPITKI